MSDWFFALWRNGGGTQRWHAGQSLSDFKTTDDAYFTKALRLVAVDTDDNAYSGVWRPGSGEQRWDSSSDVNSIVAADEQHFNHGLSLSAIAIRSDGGLVLRLEAGKRRPALALPAHDRAVRAEGKRLL